MRKEILLFCENIDALRAELNKSNYVDEETGKPVFPFANRTPVQKGNQPHTICNALIESDADIDWLESFDSVEILGTYEEVFADPDKYAKYKLAYPHDPVEVTDPETGEKTTYTPPKKFGVFA